MRVRLGMRIANFTRLAVASSNSIYIITCIVLKQRVGSVGHLRVRAFAFGGARDRTRLRLALRQSRAHAREMTALLYKDIQQLHVLCRNECIG